MTDTALSTEDRFVIDPVGRWKVTESVRVPTRGLILSFNDAAVETALHPAGECIPLRVRASRKQGHENVAFIDTSGGCCAVGSVTFWNHAPTVRVEHHFASTWLHRGSSTGRLISLSDGDRRRLADAMRKGAAADAERIDGAIALLAAALPILAADPERFPEAAVRDTSKVSAIPFAGKSPDIGFPTIRSRVFVYKSVATEIWRVMRDRLVHVHAMRTVDIEGLEPASSAHERMRAASALREMMASAHPHTVAFCPQLRHAAGMN